MNTVLFSHHSYVNELCSWAKTFLIPTGSGKRPKVSSSAAPKRIRPGMCGLKELNWRLASIWLDFRKSWGKKNLPVIPELQPNVLLISTCHPMRRFSRSDTNPAPLHLWQETKGRWGVLRPGWFWWFEMQMAWAPSTVTCTQHFSRRS